MTVTTPITAHAGFGVLTPPAGVLRVGAFVAFCRAFLRPATAITMTALTTTMPAMSAMPLSDESPLSALLSAAGRAVGRLGVVGVAG